MFLLGRLRLRLGLLRVSGLPPSFPVFVVFLRPHSHTVVGRIAGQPNSLMIAQGDHTHLASVARGRLLAGQNSHRPCQASLDRHQCLSRIAWGLSATGPVQRKDLLEAQKLA